MKKLMIMAAVVAAGGLVTAQEMGATSEATSTTTPSVSPVLAAAQEAAKDGGQEIINIAADKAAEMAAVKESEGVTAEGLVDEKLQAAGLSQGYDRDRKAIIQIGVYTISCENPVTDKKFMFNREFCADIAYNTAKAGIISAISSQFEADESVMIRCGYSDDEAKQRLADKMRQLEGKRDQLAAILADMQALSAEEAEEVKKVKVSLGDKFGIVMDAIIKKIDNTYDPNAAVNRERAVTAEYKTKMARLREECAKVRAEYSALENEANGMKEKESPITSSTISAKEQAEMPLLGASVLTQAETWNPEKKEYSVAMAVVWSPNLQDQAMKMITDDFSPMEKKGKYSLQEWKNKQEWSHMIGPRRFTDKDGKNLFIGITAVDLTGSIARQEAVKMRADLMAKKYVAFSLAGDMKAYQEAHANVNIYDDDEGRSEKFLQDINAQVNLQLNGCMRLVGKEIKHPLLNRRIYVSAAYIDPALASEAKSFMKKLFEDAGIARLVTRQKEAYQLGAKEMLKRIDAQPIVPEIVPIPDMPTIPEMPQLPKPISQMSEQEKQVAAKALTAHKRELEAQKKAAELKQQQLEAEKRAALEQAKKDELARQQRALEARKQKIEEEKLQVQVLLTKLYQAVDPEVDTNF